MPKLILVNKPFGCVCQFSPSGDRPTLADLVPVPGVYPAGRLDTDSEGLLVLTDDGRLQARIADPRHKLEKGYWVQVEGTPAEGALEALRRGVDLGDFVTRPGLGGRHRRAARAVAPGPSHSRPAGHPHGLARRADPGGPQPPGPADDREGGAAHPAPHPVPGRPLDRRRPRPGPVAGGPRLPLIPRGSPGAGQPAGHRPRYSR